MLKPVLLSDLKRYSLKLFQADLFAGLTVGVVALPMAMAFAIACSVGTAPETQVAPSVGIVTAIVAGIMIAAFGGSRTQVSGPTGAFIVIISGIIAAHGMDGLIISTIMAGIILVLMAVFRIGAMLKYIPYPVIVGFTSAIAIIIFSTQIKDIFGLTIKDGIPSDFIAKWGCYFNNLGSINYYALGLSLLTIVVILLSRRFFPKLPAMLIGMLVSTGAYLILSAVLKNDAIVMTIGQSFGELPRTLPLPKLPHLESWETLQQLAQPAFTIAFLCAIESLLSASVADGMTGDRHKPNAELLGQGLGNIASALFGGLPATGAIARTATNIKSGGKTPMSAIIHAITLMLIMLIFAPYASMIPLAALGGILAIVCWNMCEAHTFIAMFKGPRSDVFVMLITFLLTIFVDLVCAVGIGIVLSAFLFIRRMSEITDVQSLNLANADDNDELDNDPTSGYQLDHSIEVFELHGPFFFGAVESFKDTVLGVFNRKARVVILRMRDVPAIDATGLNALNFFLDQCRKKHIALILSGVTAQSLKVIQKSKFDEALGVDNICFKFKDAVQRANELVEKSRTDDPMLTHQ